MTDRPAEMPGRCIVTGADSAYFPLLAGLVASLLDSGAARAAAICVLDLGLAAAEREWCRERGASVHDGIGLARKVGLQTVRPETICSALRTILPQILPGHRSFLWIDSDAWVQDAAAVDALFGWAEEADAVAAAEIDLSYGFCARPATAAQRRDALGTIYARFYPQPRAEALSLVPMLNTGVVCARAASPVWTAWSRELIRLVADQRQDPFWGNQVAFNELHYGGRVRCHVVPAVYNWLCCCAKPAADESSGRWLTPRPPRQTIQILHLAGLPDRIHAAITVPEPDGGTRSLPLTYVRGAAASS